MFHFVGICGFKQLLKVNKMNNYSIYTLNCPKSGFIRYVGISNNPIRRYGEHLSYKYDSNKHKTNWINSLKNNSLKPSIKILESEITHEEALKKEIKYISMFKSLGYNLVNICKGGRITPSRLGSKASSETIEKMYNSSPSKKVVYQYTKDGILVGFFNGVREACRKTGIDHRSIAQVAARSETRKSAGGFKWEYKTN